MRFRWQHQLRGFSGGVAVAVVVVSVEETQNAGVAWVLVVLVVCPAANSQRYKDE